MLLDKQAESLGQLRLLVAGPSPNIQKARELADQLFQAICIKHLKERNIEQLCVGFYKKISKAPASAWKDWHCAFSGGLLVHSVAVTLRLDELCDLWYPECELSSRAFVGLLHDLGKAGDLEQDYFLNEEEEWWRTKRGRMFNYNDKIVKMPHATRSAFLLNQFGLLTTAEEFQAIVFHDGQYVQGGNSEIKNNEERLTLLTHWADYWSAHVDRI